MRQVIIRPGQIAAILIGRRKARGLSQRQLAEQIGISQARLSALEADAGAPTLGRLLELARHLGLEVIIQDKTTVLSSEW